MNALTFKTPGSLFADYTSRFSTVLKDFDWSPVEKLAYDLRDCWQTGRQVFFCGNGGSGGNANHLAN
ncbi:MAG: SIS domain-containing protein, partial [Bradyrhizobium sp.]|nr:SIS domain-containing protein [Bradyrhizobium sp.]